MYITDFFGKVEVHDDESLRKRLSWRDSNDSNRLWLRRGPEMFPLLLIFVKGEESTVVYAPDEERADFVSVNGSRSLEYTQFYINPGEPHASLTEQVVPFRTALDAAREFLHSPDLPRCVEWLEL